MLDRLSELSEIQGQAGVGEADGSLGSFGGQLGGALARLGGGAPQAGANGSGSGADGFSHGPNDGMGGAEGLAASMAANFAAAFGGGQAWDGRIQQEAKEVLALKGVDGVGGVGASGLGTNGVGSTAGLGGATPGAPAGQTPQAVTESGGDPAQRLEQAAQKLQQDYSKAKNLKAPLTQQTEDLARRALDGMQQQQDNAQGQGAADQAGGQGDAGGNAGSGDAGSAPTGGDTGGSSGAGSSGGAGSTGGSGSAATSGGSSSNDRGPAPPQGPGTWGAGDQKFLDQALSQPMDFNNVFSWGQGSEGNCAAVATIKAAMDVYDNQIFDKVERTPDGGYRITMQDGVTVNLSAKELSQAADASQFIGPDSVEKSYATLAYAAMAKRAQMEGHEGARNYTEALNNIANGDNPYDSARFLGLKNMTQDVDPSRANGGNAVVGWNSKHAVYIDDTSSGTKTDQYGTPRNYDGTDTKGRGLNYGFTFKPRSSNGGGTGNPGEGRTVSAPSSPASSPVTSSRPSGGSSTGGSHSGGSSGSSGGSGSSSSSHRSSSSHSSSSSSHRSSSSSSSRRSSHK